MKNNERKWKSSLFVVHLGFEYSGRQTKKCNILQCRTMGIISPIAGIYLLRRGGRRVLHWRTKHRPLDCGIIGELFNNSHTNAGSDDLSGAHSSIPGMKPKAQSPLLLSFGSVCLGFQGPRINGVPSGFRVLQGSCVTQRWPYARVRAEGGGAFRYMCEILILIPISCKMLNSESQSKCINGHTGICLGIQCWQPSLTPYRAHAHERY